MDYFTHKIDFKTTINPIEQCAMIEMERIAGEHRDRMGKIYINAKEKAIREALIALGWTPPEGNWQPIETIPATMELVLVWDSIRGVPVPAQFNGIAMAHFLGDKVINPTHWMPLPQPPQ